MTRLARLLGPVLVCPALAAAAPLCAQGGEAQGGNDGAAGDAARDTRTMDASEFFLSQFEHLEPHPWGPFYDTNLFQLIAIGLMLAVFVPVLLSLRGDGTGSAPWIVRVFRGWCHWLRDEVVYRVMGEEEGRKFAPYFIYLFFFIAFMNVVGLIPGSVTPTATVLVTGPLAVITLTLMVVGGMMKQGVVAYWKHLLPPGLPGWMVPLMVVVEYVGLLVKPFALMIRLFANMLAGHLLIYAFVGMIFVFAKMFDLSWISFGPAVLVVAMGVFIMIIEALVVLLQAYIFVFLSVLFVQEARHPAH